MRRTVIHSGIVAAASVFESDHICGDYDLCCQHISRRAGIVGIRGSIIEPDVPSAAGQHCIGIVVFVVLGQILPRSRFDTRIAEFDVGIAACGRIYRQADRHRHQLVDIYSVFVINLNISPVDIAEFQIVRSYLVDVPYGFACTFRVIGNVIFHQIGVVRSIGFGFA